MPKHVKIFLNLLSFLLLFNILAAQNRIPLPENSKNNTKLEEKGQIELNKPPIDSSKKVSTLKTQIKAAADDQIHERANEMSYLIRNAFVEYEDLKIYADYIEINWKTGKVFAVGKTDSIGRTIEKTITIKGDQQTEQDAFSYNINTEEGIAYNVTTMQGNEMAVLSERVKRANDSVYYATGARLTTDPLVLEGKTEIPDYYISSTPAKFIRKNKDTDETLVVAGPSQLFIEEVPTPFIIPFVYAPSGSKRAAGILLPSFGEREELGFYLDGLGFYIPLGEYLDFTLTSDIYTKGSWGLHSVVNYKKRYAFSGNFRMDYETRISGIKGLSNYAKSRLYRVAWSHQQDPKSNPNLIFSASVNFNSSEYFRNGVTITNLLTDNVLQSTTSSSISLTKTFEKLPFTLSVTANHSQNNNTDVVNLTLPQVSLNMQRIYPFAPKVGSKKGLLKRLSLDYSVNLENRITTNTEDFLTSRMFDEAQNGIRHRLGLQTGITLMKYFPVTFSAGYNEVWYLETFNKFYDFDNDALVEEKVSGFDAYRTFNLSVGVSTNLYGTWVNKKEDAKIQAIRHTVTPSVSMGYNPDFSDSFWGYYDTYRGADGKKVEYSRFENGIYGQPSSGLSQTIGIGLNNVVEMKVRNETDSTSTKKIKIFESFNFSTGYNIAADSMRWSPIQYRGSTTILKGLRFQFGGIINPYKLVFENETSTTGVRVNEFGGLQITAFNFSTSYRFDGSTFGVKDVDASKYKRKGTLRYENFYYDENGYAKYNFPWSVDVGFRYDNQIGNSRESNQQITATISGRVSPSPHWDISVNTNYDFVANEFSYTRFSFSRDVRSFSLTFSWVPFGRYKTWDFFFGIKASILSDALKYDDNSSPVLNGTFGPQNQ